jgi:hypothetical protein
MGLWMGGEDRWMDVYNDMILCSFVVLCGLV